MSATGRIRRILHPSDFSAASAPALKRAIAMAKSNRAELVLAHVLAPALPVVGDGYISPTVWTDLQRSVETHGRTQLEALAKRVRQAGVRARTVLLNGSPFEQIVRVAKSKHADLIVMGTHGRGGFSKLFLGSVAERVIGRAPCPVLTVRRR